MVSGRHVAVGLCLAWTVVAAVCDVGAAERVRPGILGPQGWYPDDPVELEKSVEAYLAQAPEPPETTKRIRAVIVPHAGHRYSGRTAAYAYKLLAGQPIRRVIMIGPSHRADFRGASVAPYDAYETPLGKVPVDRAVCDALLESEVVQAHERAHAVEHCLEVQLPFLQKVLPDAKIVPILIRSLSPENCFEIAERVQPFLTDETVLLISSDFTHQGSSFRYIPYKQDTPVENIPGIVRAFDFAAINDILTLNLHGFWSFCDRTQVTICGRDPIKILLAALPAQTEAGVLFYETSGDLTGDYRSSVSYTAIVFRENPSYLDESEQDALLKLARKRLADTLDARKIVDYKPDESVLTPRLKEPKGVFVTLNKHGRLRGCIGILEPSMPLHEAVADRVLKSAFDDRRFQQVQPDELDELEIEISVMTPLRQVPSHSDIVLGRDGMTVEKNGRSAIYLPQVALAQGWNVEETLSHLCEKAGLAADDWKEDCKFQTFQAQVFGEDFRDTEGLQSD